MGDLPSYRPHYRKLPPELNRQIFFCFKPATQRKFICGLGWDFYAMFSHRLLTKTKRVCNPARNGWNRTMRGAIVSTDGLRADSNTRRSTNICAEKGFAISGKHSRVNSFPGTIIYYYEVKLLSYSYCRIGLSNGNPTAEWIGEYPNSYSIPTGYDFCWLAGEMHSLNCRTEPFNRSRKRTSPMYGCGLVIDPNDKLSIFFTLNGILMGRQTPISPSVDYLFPTVTFVCVVPSAVEANFGNDKEKPFEYDIEKCPGMELDCI